MARRPLILITNDDGITSPGIGKLVSLAEAHGELVVVAPDSPQSCMGHAITMDMPLRLHTTDIFGSSIEAYACSGTPADCVKMACSHLLPTRRRPSLILSGINHGSNASINVLYSGTMSAAIEGALGGIAAMGFSLGSYQHQAPMGHVDEVVSQLIAQVLARGLKRGIALNVNLPAHSGRPLLGYRFCKQADAHWREEVKTGRDLRGRTYVWMGGDLGPHDSPHAEDDLSALAENYASVVPCAYDLTDYEVLRQMREQWQVETSSK